MRKAAADSMVASGLLEEAGQVCSFVSNCQVPSDDQNSFLPSEAANLYAYRIPDLWFTCISLLEDEDVGLRESLAEDVQRCFISDRSGRSHHLGVVPTQVEKAANISVLGNRPLRDGQEVSIFLQKWRTRFYDQLISFATDYIRAEVGVDWIGGPGNHKDIFISLYANLLGLYALSMCLFDRETEICNPNLLDLVELEGIIRPFLRNPVISDLYLLVIQSHEKKHGVALDPLVPKTSGGSCIWEGFDPYFLLSLDDCPYSSPTNFTPFLWGLPFPPLPRQDIQQCLSSLQNINGYLAEIFASFTSGRAGQLGPVCCKAITDINTSCWPKLFPFNPSFPPLLMGNCATVLGAAPSTTPIPKGTTTKAGESSVKPLTVASAPTSLSHHYLLLVGNKS
ncbi:hypothetical protein IFM89_005542 [Coptis chinensis]|uniref:Prolamin-like domain-containing protein n=1 Tax=Coptis chinensis TaxID=261450 RepID=A0A835LEH3_9MAGN|nr:hypothetical protein IFM89_005542 [Coptis chinensis]